MARGINIGPQPPYTFQLVPGAFNLLGYPADLETTGSTGYALSLDQGGFALSGQVANLLNTVRGITVNWQPGVYMLSSNVNSWTAGITGANGKTGGGQNQFEITKIVSSLQLYPLIFKGYAPQYYWAAIDQDGTLAGINAAGPNDDFQKFVAACAAGGVPGYFVPNIGAFAITGQIFNANDGQRCIPLFIFNGATGTYGTPPTGANGAGWAYANYDGTSRYGFVIARFDFSATNTAWKNFWKNFGNTPLTANAGPYAGQAFTWATHPQVSAFVDWTDPDPNMLNSPVTPSNWNGGAWNLARANQGQTIPATIPHMLFGGPMAGFGANGSGALVANQLTILQDQQIGGAAFTCTDVFWTGNARALTYAQNFLIGNKNTAPDPGNPVWAPGGTNFVGTMASLPTVEGLDYNYSTSTPFTLGQVQGILSVAYNVLQANYVFMASDDARFGGAWSGSGTAAASYGSNGISGAIATVPFPALNQEITKSNMPVVNILAVGAATLTSLTVYFTPVTGVGPNVKYQVFRNGSPVGVPQTNTSYVDSPLTTGVTYTYTVAMVNANGTGPQGPGVTGVPGVPAIAAAAGYNTQTFGPGPVLNTNWFPQNFYRAATGGYSQSDNRIILDGTGNGYGICTAQSTGGAAPNKSWSGIAFGGGAYFEALVDFVPSATPGAPWPAFWANDIETMSQNAVTAATQVPGQATGIGNWGEIDAFELDQSNITEYGTQFHAWHGTIPGATDLTLIVGATSVGTALSNGPNRIGILWTPATPGTPGSGSLKYYFNGTLVKTTTWNPYSSAVYPPVDASVTDVRHWAPMLVTGTACPMTVYSVSVWQASGANNLTGGSVAGPTGLVMTLQGQTSANNTPSPPTPTSPNSQTLSWNAVTGATAYKIYRSVNGGAFVLYASPAGTVTTFTDGAATNCVNGTAGATQPQYAANTYLYKVTAVVSGVESSQSATQSAIFYQNGVRTCNGGDLDFGGMTSNYNDTTGAPQGGTADILNTVTGAFAGWLPYSGNDATQWNMWLGPYNYLYIDLKPSVANQIWNIYFARVGDILIYNSGGGTNVITINASTPYGPAPQLGVWATYKIPLATILKDYGSPAFSGGPVQQNAFYKFAVQDQTGLTNNRWWVDNVIFAPT